MGRYVDRIKSTTRGNCRKNNEQRPMINRLGKLTRKSCSEKRAVRIDKNTSSAVEDVNSEIASATAKIVKAIAAPVVRLSTTEGANLPAKCRILFLEESMIERSNFVNNHISTSTCSLKNCWPINEMPSTRRDVLSMASASHQFPSTVALYSLLLSSVSYLFSVNVTEVVFFSVMVLGFLEAESASNFKFSVQQKAFVLIQPLEIGSSNGESRNFAQQGHALIVVFVLYHVTHFLTVHEAQHLLLPDMVIAVAGKFFGNKVGDINVLGVLHFCRNIKVQNFNSMDVFLHMTSTGNVTESSTKLKPLHPAYNVTNINNKVRTLDGTKITYSTWVKLFRLHATAYKAMDHITNVPPPEKDAPEYAEWKEVDSLVLHWIYSTVSDEIVDLAEQLEDVDNPTPTEAAVATVVQTGVAVVVVGRAVARASVHNGRVSAGTMDPLPTVSGTRPHLPIPHSRGMGLMPNSKVVVLFDGIGVHSPGTIKFGIYDAMHFLSLHEANHLRLPDMVLPVAGKFLGNKVGDVNI
ncbi:hypothetical protein Ccrd_026215 [Cynara cardunculus var. scolymus]|uniref:Uncharacterized protein n=1 Tax=Cynara cardunculus var. scolymus TaxID=59895 RepID=A0A103XDH3_CYNCS|nr:hypothetical protein Ccrd_026215 [Cynara cardunculus var. scolymus]